MGIQKKILEKILDIFQELQQETKPDFIIYQKALIRKEFKKSINKTDLTRRILHDVMLSETETLELLKIIYNTKD